MEIMPKGMFFKENGPLAEAAMSGCISGFLMEEIRERASTSLGALDVDVDVYGLWIIRCNARC